MMKHLRVQPGQPWTMPGFDQAFPGLELVSASEEQREAVLRLPVSPAVQNLNGTLHGGAMATLVDIAGTLAILVADRDGRPGVTTDLNLTCLAPGTGAVRAVSRVLKLGRTMAFITCDLLRESDGTLVALGRMTKHLGAPAGVATKD